MISPKHLQIGTELLQWARDYLMSENPNIKRPRGNQVVCPFVKSAVDNESFYFEFHDEVFGITAKSIEEVMYDAKERFKRLGPFSENDKYKKALLVVFPKLPEKQTPVLDIAHSNIKTTFVRDGLMVGQFHKNCDERGVYNRAFKVSISPYPLIAIRHMAVHDIIFVGNVPEWFAIYNVLFGHLFNEPQSIDDYNKHLIDYYLAARARFVAKPT